MKMLFCRVFFLSPLRMPCLLHCALGLTKPAFLQNIKHHHIVLGQGLDSWEKGREVISIEETMCKGDIKIILCFMILNMFSIDTLRKPGSFFPLLFSFRVLISVHLLVF